MTDQEIDLALVMLAAAGYKASRWDINEPAQPEGKVRMYHIEYFAKVPDLGTPDATRHQGGTQGPPAPGTLRHGPPREAFHVLPDKNRL